MGMSLGSGGGQSANINVTPLIDVLLVLLIIFMVITPLTPKGLDALVPQPPPPNAPKNNTPDRTIVVQLIDRGAGQDPGLKINQEDATWDNLQGRLADIYKTRAEKVMFVKGDDADPLRRRGQRDRHRACRGSGQGRPDHREDRSGRLRTFTRGTGPLQRSGCRAIAFSPRRGAIASRAASVNKRSASTCQPAVSGPRMLWQGRLIPQ